jgi:DNA-directed RNA polymerase specialized sigma subunit
MTAKEYLHQAYRLDHKINSDIEELQRLREMSYSLSSPQLGDRVQTTRSNEASFVKCICKIRDMEEKINAEIDLFVDLKKEIRSVIEKVENTDEQMVLRYRYIHNMTWLQIGDELHADKSTIRRWHGQALAHVVLPENPIRI